MRPSSDQRPAPIILLTCRPQHSDFRYDLARELHALGHDLLYIYLKRRPEVTDLATGVTETWSLLRLCRYFIGLRGRRPRPVVLQSTNLILPPVILLLQRLGGARWVFDMHDDLLYNKVGMARLRARLSQKAMIAQSDLMVHAAPTLKSLFPRSRHIGNGSSLMPLPKVREDPSRVLILASLDGRIDFDLLSAGVRACPARHFEIHGRVSENDPVIRAALEAVLAGAPNISYHGPYTDRDLPELLSHYLVTFAPYKVGSRLTQFIDPLRFHHCLASGVGIVSTAIPAAVEMKEAITILDAPEALDAALDRAAAHRGGGGRSWREVALTFQEIVADR
ncbi:MAG: hypothetical protein QM690_11775 [Sphingobium sp.]